MTFDVVRHPDDLDWLFRPVDAGWTDARALYDGSLSLHHVAEMNEVLDVKEENERRAAAAQRAAS